MDLDIAMLQGLDTAGPLYQAAAKSSALTSVQTAAYVKG